MDRAQPSLGCAFFNELPYRLVDVDPDGDVAAAVELDITDDLRGPGGALHAGFIALLADVAGAIAVVQNTERPTATSAVSMHNLATARVGPIRATANVLRMSTSRAVADVHVIDRGMDDRLVAAAHITIALM